MSGNKNMITMNYIPQIIRGLNKYYKKYKLMSINVLNKLRHKPLRCPALTEISVYSRSKSWVVFCECCVKCVYFLHNPWGEGK
jgi:hypothetical protein